MSAIRPLSGAQRTSAQRVIRSATRARGKPAGHAPWRPQPQRPLLLELALALLGLGDLPPVDVPAATSGADRSPLSGANRKTSAQSELYRF